MARRNRREYLTILATVTTGVIAGCTDDPEDDPDPDPENDEVNGDEEADDTEEDPDEEEEADDTEEDPDEEEEEAEFVDEIDEQVVLEYGDTARVSTGADITVQGITLYDQMGDEQPEERDVFAVVTVETENTSDEQQYLPAATGQWELFYGDQQIDQTFNAGALNAENYEQLEGGDVQGGVTREGVVLFEIDDDIDTEEIDTLFFDNFQMVEETGQTIDVRWTTNS